MTDLVIAGVPVPYRESPNKGGALIAQRFLVMHYTAGRGAEQSVNWLCNPKAKASAHFVVGRDGSITQLVPCNVRAWHAGKSAWRDVTGLNDYSIGIEIDNPGRLVKTAKGWATYFGTPVDDADVVLAQHKHESHEAGWYRYPEEQILAAYVLCEALIDAYPSIEDVIGHEDIAPGRKTDPGPAWPMESFRSWLFGRGAG